LNFSIASRWEKATSGKSAVASLLMPFNTNGAAIIMVKKRTQKQLKADNGLKKLT